MKKYPCLGLIFLWGILFCPVVTGHPGCPPQEDVQPCVCHSRPYPVLECNGVKDDEVLKSVFQGSEKYTYRQVHIYYSTLKYLPQEMFDNTVVKELFIQNSTLEALFDSPPDGLHELYKLHLENTRIEKLSHWELISPLTHLEQLEIMYDKIDSIDSTFGKNVPKDLTQLTMVETGTKEIAEGAFTLFPHLDKVEIVLCELKQLSRSYFPDISNIRFLYFNNNKLVSIPKDMFRNMPHLYSVGLRNNFLKTVPESAFEGTGSVSINFFSLEGNPLKCDCSLLWLIKNKPKHLVGSCATPIRLHDRELKDLTPHNFRCHKHP